MKFSTDTWKDLQKYFQGAYVKFPNLAGETLHYVDKVGPDGLVGKLYSPDAGGVYTSKTFQFKLYDDDGQAPEVEFILPRKSYFMYEDRAYLLYRIPARQYHRGITSENTAIAKLNGNGGFSSQSLSFELLNAYVTKTKFHKFGSSLNSYAVSSRVAVGDDGLFIDRVKVGSIKGNRLVLDSSLFVSLFEQLVRDHGQNYSVVTRQQMSAKKAGGKGYVPPKVKEEA